MENLLKLMKVSKVMYDNLGVLHRNLAGANFLSAHEQLQEYYEKVSDLVDYVNEVGISVGVREPNLAFALEVFQAIEVRDRNEVETLKIVKSYFDRLIELIDYTKEEVHVCVASELETYQEYFRKHASYIISRRLIDTAKTNMF